MSTDPDICTVFIGPTVSGSWSAMEAMTEAIGRESAVDLSAYTAGLKPGEFPSLQRMLEVERDNLRQRAAFPVFINTHDPIPIHVCFPERKFRYITLLRNPVRRFISYYHYCALWKDHDLHWVSPVIRAGATLEQYVDFVMKTGFFPGGLVPGDYFYKPWAQLGLIPRQFVDHNQIYKGSCHVLETYFEVVGITEMFDESLFVFSRMLGLKEPPKWRMRGKSGVKHAAIAATVRDKVKHIVQGEMALYTMFVERFLEKHRRDIELFKSMGISLRMEGDEDRVDGPAEPAQGGD